jgi:hypothetical protein
LIKSLSSNNASKNEGADTQFCFIFISARIFLKKQKSILGFYMPVFKEIILKVRKYFANLEKKTTKGVDRPRRVG